MKGKLVVFEGIDGSGTETQSKMLLFALKKQGLKAERLEYPDYAGDLGATIRRFLEKKTELSAQVQFLLYALDMVKDREKIERMLSEGKTVICDRYFTSTIAYQGIRGFPQDKAMRFAEDFGLPKPDIVFFLRITPEESMKRKMGEHGKLDRNEEDKALLSAVNASYGRMASENVFGKWFIIDGGKPKDEVHAEVRNVLKSCGIA
ncbi:MAG: dTMP kinase [Candidatus Aenigmatarchaeota archaeon]